MARSEAINRKHEYIGTEHLLLGLMREGDGIAASVFQNLGANLEEIRATIDGVVTSGERNNVPAAPLPYTTRAKKVLELAMASTIELDHHYVGTEHLLLGLLREGKGIAAQVLRKGGLTEQSVRAEIVRLLGGGSTLGQPATDAAVASVSVEVQFADGTVITQTFSTPGAAIDYLQK